MNEQKKVITVKDVRSVFKHHRKSFVITFSMVFVLGLLFVWLRPPVYSVEASIRLSDNSQYYDQILLENFPQQAEMLWLFEDSDKRAGENKVMNRIKSQVNNQEFAKQVREGLSFDISLEELERSIIPYRHRNRILELKTIHSDRQKTYQILQETVAGLKESQQEKLQAAYEELLEEIDRKIEQEPNAGSEKIASLVSARVDLVQNKEQFIERIELKEEVGMENVFAYTNRVRETTIAFSLAVFLGLIASFAKYHYKKLQSD